MAETAKRQYFGTDGVRGVANQHPMTPEFVTRLGQAAAKVLGMHQEKAGTRLKCVVGRDARLSGDMLEAALTAGLASMGVDVVLCGVVPTPAVALIARQEKAALGAIVSASHNPYTDNGVKFVDGEGHKLTDAQELEIEAAFADESRVGQRAAGTAVGRVSRMDTAAERFIAHAVATMQGRRLDGMKVALDNANGAAYVTSTETLNRLGAEVSVFHSTPNG